MSKPTPVAPPTKGNVQQGELEVLVVTQHGTPVEGVVVEVHGQYGGKHLPDPPKTDAKGRHLVAKKLTIPQSGEWDTKLWLDLVGEVPAPGAPFHPGGLLWRQHLAAAAPGARKLEKVVAGGFAMLRVVATTHTGQPLAGVDIEVLHFLGDLAGKKKPLLRTNEHGVLERVLPIMTRRQGAVVSEWVVKVGKPGYSPSPSEVVIKPESGGTHHLSVSGPYQPIVASIAPSTDGKWFINQPHDQPKRLGRYPMLRARLDGPLANRSIFFTLLPGKGNRALPQSRQATFLAPMTGPDADAPIRTTLEVKTDAGGAAEVVLRLSTYGGDTFRVLAATSAGAKVGDPGTRVSGTFEVWRSIAYEVETMKRPGAGDYSNRLDEAGLKKEFARCFVALNRVGADDHPSHQRVITATELDGFGEARRQGTPGRYFQLVLCDSVSMHPPVLETVQKELTTSPAKITLSDRDIDPRAWFVAAARALPGGGTAALQKDTHVKLALEGDGVVLTVDLAGTGPLPAPGAPVKVGIQLHKHDTSAGIKKKNTTYVAIRWQESAFSGATLARSLLNTVIHEAGHTMGMAATQLEDATPCPTHYELAGHHCSHPHTTTVGKAGFDCVMYGVAVGNVVFCPHCTRALRARVLTSLPVAGIEAMDAKVL